MYTHTHSVFPIFCVFCFSNLLKIVLINTKQEFLSALHKLACQLQWSRLYSNEVKFKRKIRPILLILFLLSPVFSIDLLPSLIPFPAANYKEFWTSVIERYLSGGWLLQLNSPVTHQELQVHRNPDKYPTLLVVLCFSLYNTRSRSS